VVDSAYLNQIHWRLLLCIQECRAVTLTCQVVCVCMSILLQQNQQQSSQAAGQLVLSTGTASATAGAATAIGISSSTTAGTLVAGGVSSSSSTLGGTNGASHHICTGRDCKQVSNHFFPSIHVMLCVDACSSISN
jgi:hypothetical protein